MAAPIKNFLICFKIIFDRSYRSLSSDTSQEQYRDEFKLMGIPDLKGLVCHVCCNKVISDTELFTHQVVQSGHFEK